MMCLQAFKHAKHMADAEAAKRKTPLKLASADEIRRVLNAKTDYDCLQVRILTLTSLLTQSTVLHGHKSMLKAMLPPALV